MQPDDKISKRWGVDLRKSNDPFDWLLNAELYICSVKDGEQLAKGSRGTWKSFLFSPTRTWIRSLLRALSCVNLAAPGNIYIVVPQTDLRKVEYFKFNLSYSQPSGGQLPGIPLECLLFIRALVDHRREELDISQGGDISRCWFCRGCILGTPIAESIRIQPLL